MYAPTAKGTAGLRRVNPRCAEEAERRHELAGELRDAGSAMLGREEERRC